MPELPRLNHVQRKRHRHPRTKRYKGTRDNCRITVTVNGRPLNPRYDLRNHSPDGFEWGYGGSGPAQLALAILADHFGKDAQAVILYQEFKRAVIASLPEESWTLTTSDIKQALSNLKP